MDKIAGIISRRRQAGPEVLPELGPEQLLGSINSRKPDDDTDVARKRLKEVTVRLAGIKTEMKGLEDESAELTAEIGPLVSRIIPKTEQ